MSTGLNATVATKTFKTFKTFKAKIVKDLVVKIKSHCCMLGVTIPYVRTYDESLVEHFTELDDYVSNIDIDDISSEAINYLRDAERYYLRKVIAINAAVQVDYETYIAIETEKYIQKQREYAKSQSTGRACL